MHVIQIKIDHGYCLQIIHKLIDNSNSPPPPNALRQPCPVHRKISCVPTMYRIVRNIFNRFSMQTIAYPTKNLFFCYRQKKQDLIPTFFFSGIYEIPLQLNTGLVMFYICMTKQRLFKRIKKQN